MLSVTTVEARVCLNARFKEIRTCRIRGVETLQKASLKEEKMFFPKDTVDACRQPSCWHCLRQKLCGM